MADLDARAAEFVDLDGERAEREAIQAEARGEIQAEDVGRQTEIVERAEETTPLLSVSLLDLEKNPPPPVRFAVEPLVAFSELLLLFGKPYGGKSIFCLQLAFYAALGLARFLNTFSFPRPLRSQYVDEEMGLPLLNKRAEMMKNQDRVGRGLWDYLRFDFLPLRSSRAANPTAGLRSAGVDF